MADVQPQQESALLGSIEAVRQEEFRYSVQDRGQECVAKSYVRQRWLYVLDAQPVLEISNGNAPSAVFPENTIVLPRHSRKALYNLDYRCSLPLNKSAW